MGQSGGGRRQAGPPAEERVVAVELAGADDGVLAHLGLEQHERNDGRHVDRVQRHKLLHAQQQPHRPARPCCVIDPNHTHNMTEYLGVFVGW